MKRIVVAALAAVLAPGFASAEVWTVAEGPAAKIKGTWNVTVAGGSLSGNATMSGADGHPLTYGLSGTQKDGGFVVHRINSSDHLACTYVGKPQGGNAITGAVLCNGANAPWIATRRN